MPSEHPFARNTGCRISDAIQYMGLRVIVLENELLRVAILPDKGAEICSLRFKPADIDPLLSLPRGLRTPTPFPPTIPSRDGSFNDFYVGGWQEMLPSAGGPTTVLGAEIGRHGEVALLPWQWEIIEDDAARVAVRLWVRTVRTPFYLERIMSLESGHATLNIQETVTNEGGEELPLMWGHHLAFGEPFLDDSCVLQAPAERVEVHAGPANSSNRLVPGSTGSWPITTGANETPVDLRPIPSRDARSADMLYLLGLRAGWYALTNRRLGQSLVVEWDTNAFPVLWVWQEFCGSLGYPWYGNTYALGLEPCSGYAPIRGSGLAEAIGAGQEKRLAAGSSMSGWLKASFYRPRNEGLVPDHPNELGELVDLDV